MVKSLGFLVIQEIAHIINYILILLIQYRSVLKCAIKISIRIGQQLKNHFQKIILEVM